MEKKIGLNLLSEIHFGLECAEAANYSFKLFEIFQVGISKTSICVQYQTEKSIST